MNPRPPRPLLVLLLAAVLPAAPRADVTLLQGPAGGKGSVLVLDETGGHPPLRPGELQGILLLPVDCSGRTALEALSPAVPHLREDVPGAGRVLLPNGLGSLYRFRRDDPGGARFGLFLVDASGVTRPLWERDGTGPGGAGDPFPARLGISPAGDAVLVTTTPAAGGDALEIELATGAVVDHTSGLAPQDFVDGGTWLGGSWGAACTATGVLRFDRGAGGAATGVPLPAGTTSFAGNVVASADGGTLATVAGTGPGTRQVYAFRRTGGVTQVSTIAGAISDAGYLPESTVGPTLALSPDGGTCAWRTEGITKEAFVRRVAAPTGAFQVQITSNALFTDTLDDTADFLFRTLTSMVLVVGAQNPQVPGAIESADVFQVDFLPGGATSIRNVTNTSGDTRFPFTTPGQLGSEGGIYALEAGERFLAQRRANGTGDVITARAGHTGSQVLVSDVKSLDLAFAAGPYTALSLRRDLKPRTRELWSVAGGSAAQLLQLSDAFDLVEPVGDGMDRLGLIVTDGTNRWLVRTRLSRPALQLLSPFPLAYGPALELTPAGTLVASVDTSPATSAVGAWAASGALSLLAAGGPLRVLPSR